MYFGMSSVCVHFLPVFYENIQYVAFFYISPNRFWLDQDENFVKFVKNKLKSIYIYPPTPKISTTPTYTR